MTELNYVLTSSDDLWINCYKAIASVTTISWSSLFKTDTLLQNVLYNMGYMFTDILDLVFYDPTNTDPYWYYVAYRVGDFFIRFLYYDTTA